MDGAKKSTSNKKTSLIIFVTLLVAFVAYGKVTGHLSDQWFLDRITVASFQPSAEISELVEKSSMNEHAKIYFFATEPELDERVEFNQNCAELLNEASLILGCYNGRTYLFNVTDERIKGVRYVTAAHEMLHAAYDRLGIFDKMKVDELIQAEIDNTTDEDVLEALQIYEELEPGQEINEMHSILGTESRNLSPELEKYYERYFFDRSVVVAEHEKYEAIFDDMEKRADELEHKMTVLEQEIDSEQTDYELAAAQLAQDIDDFNYGAMNGDFFDEASFYARRSSVVARQNALSARADALNAKIDEYNSYVEELQALGRDAEVLQGSLDSKSI